MHAIIMVKTYDSQKALQKKQNFEIFVEFIHETLNKWLLMVTNNNDSKPSG